MGRSHEICNVLQLGSIGRVVKDFATVFHPFSVRTPTYLSGSPGLPGAVSGVSMTSRIVCLEPTLTCVPKLRDSIFESFLLTNETQPWERQT